MWMMPASPALLLAAICAAAMGFAIQRGATCAVVAVEEILTTRKAKRLAAMAEASLWVTGGLVIAQALGLLAVMPAGYPLGGWTLAGGVLLGLGAYVNGACAFGSLARLGRGEWAYLATPLGFFAGCLGFRWLFGDPPAPLMQGSPVLGVPAALALPVAALMIWRIARPAASVRRAGGWARELAARAWSPHAATVVIAIAFVVMLPTVGAWSYTDAVADLARGMLVGLEPRGLLLFSLMGGAVVGGWSAGQLARWPTTRAQIIRCLAGGAIMGLGGMLVPGANDGLILVGMPLLWPYAWVAFLAMCAAIAVALLAGRSLAAPSP